MSCRTSQRLSAYQRGALSQQQQVEIEAHLQVCAACRRELRQLEKLDRLLATLDPVAAPEDLTRRALQDVRATWRVPLHRRVPVLSLSMTGSLAALLCLLAMQITLQMGQLQLREDTLPSSVQEVAATLDAPESAPGMPAIFLTVASAEAAKSAPATCRTALPLPLPFGQIPEHKPILPKRIVALRLSPDVQRFILVRAI